MKRILLYLTALLTVLSSCGEFEKYLDIDSSIGATPRIVVNGTVKAGELPILFISKTLPINVAYDSSKKWEALSIDEATVKYYINDKLIETQVAHKPTLEDTPGHQNDRPTLHQAFFKGSVAPQPGDRVRFEVASPDLASVYSEVYLPLRPKCTVVKTQRIQVKRTFFSPGDNYDDADYWAMKMQLELQKPTDVEDLGIGFAFYGIPPHGEISPGAIPAPLDYSHRDLRVADDLIFSKDAVNLCYYINRNNNYMAEGYPPYLSTGDIRGDKYILTLSGRVQFSRYKTKPDVKNKIRLIAMDPFYHEWAKMRYGLKDIRDYKDQDLDLTEGLGDPLAEPILDITNVHGGRGIVLATTEVEVVVYSE